MRIYVGVWAALMALLGATVAAYWIPLGRLNLAVGMGIAGVKTLLVMAYFMHVRLQPKLVWIWSAVGFYWLAILLALTQADFLMR
jgi:cytochrome c oxidase subunit 4